MGKNGNFLNHRFLFFNFFYFMVLKAKLLQESIQIKGQLLNDSQTKIELLEAQLEEINEILTLERADNAEKLKVLEDVNAKLGKDFLGFFKFSCLLL